MGGTRQGWTIAGALLLLLALALPAGARTLRRTCRDGAARPAKCASPALCPACDVDAVCDLSCTFRVTSCPEGVCQDAEQKVAVGARAKLTIAAPCPRGTCDTRLVLRCRPHPPRASCPTTTTVAAGSTTTTSLVVPTTTSSSSTSTSSTTTTSTSTSSSTTTTSTTSTTTSSTTTTTTIASTTTTSVSSTVTTTTAVTTTTTTTSAPGSTTTSVTSTSSTTVGSTVTTTTATSTTTTTTLTPLASLDLLDPTATADVVAAQTAGLIGGSLVLDGGGTAVGGDAVITPDDLSPALTGLRVPFGVTLHLQGFADDFPGVEGAPVVVDGTLSFVGGGSTTLSSDAGIHGTSSGHITSDGPLTLQAAVVSFSGDLSGDEVNVDADGGVTVGDVSATAGSIELFTAVNGVTILPGSNLTASAGDLHIESDGTAGGSVTIGSGATLFATNAGFAEIVISVASFPLGDPGTTPSNVMVQLLNGGAVFFGEMGITALAPTNTLTVDGGEISFEAGSDLGASGIVLGGSVNMTVVAN